MKIHTLRAWLKKLPLTKPYTIAYKTISETEIIFLEIILENGVTGLGAANPFPEVVGETAKATLANLQNEVEHYLRGKDIRHFQRLIDATQKTFPNSPGTLAAVDIALHDVFAKHIGLSVLNFYGEKVQSLPTSVTIGIKDTASVMEEAKKYHSLGFRVLKLKTGHHVEEDIERVCKLKEMFSDVVIRVDANQGYGLNDLQEFMQATAGLVEVIEQPLKRGGEPALQSLGPKQRKLLVADESLLDSADAFTLSHPLAPYGVYNIKLMKCGGIKAAREIALIAKHAGIDLFWGCNDESIVSITAALHAAYSCDNTKYLDLDGSFDLSKDLVEGGFVLKDGCLLPINEPGLGFKKV